MAKENLAQMAGPVKLRGHGTEGLSDAIDPCL